MQNFRGKLKIDNYNKIVKNNLIIYVCLYTVFGVKQYEGGWETKMYTFPMEQVQLYTHTHTYTYTRKATEKQTKNTNDAIYSI